VRKRESGRKEKKVKKGEERGKRAGGEGDD